MSEVTIDELNKKLEVLFELKAKKDALDDELSVINKELETVKMDVTKILESKGMDGYKGPNGSISWKKELYVNMPDGEDKLEFFNYLKSKGAFEALASVHAARLNAWYREEMNNNNDPMFAVPGISLPKERYAVTVRGKK
jgi:hypothetical protein